MAKKKKKTRKKKERERKKGKEMKCLSHKMITEITSQAFASKFILHLAIVNIYWCSY